MYTFEVRVVSAPQASAPLQPTERAGRKIETSDSPEASERKQQPVPVEKNMAAEKAKQEQREQLHEILSKMAGAGRYLSFEKHEATGEWIIRVCDSETDEVIREIPPEKILDMMSKFCEFAGMLMDESA